MLTAIVCLHALLRTTPQTPFPVAETCPWDSWLLTHIHMCKTTLIRQCSSPALQIVLLLVHRAARREPPEEWVWAVLPSDSFPCRFASSPQSRRIQFPELQAAHLNHIFPFRTHTTCSLCFEDTQLGFIPIRERLSTLHENLVACPKFTFATPISLWNADFTVLETPHTKHNPSSRKRWKRKASKNPILFFFCSRTATPALDHFSFKQLRIPWVSVLVAMHKRINKN